MLLAMASALVGTAFTYAGQDTVKAAACAAPSTDLGTDTLTFNVPADGNYVIWTRMIAPDASNNSINMEVDGNNCYNVGGGSFTAASWADNTSNWINYADGATSTPISLSLTTGQHTLKYVGTKAGVEVDRIIITSDTTCTPTGVGTNCQQGTGGPGDDTEAPSVPGNLRTSVVTANSVALAWDASTDNLAVTGYVIYRNGTEVGPSTTNAYTDNAVTPDTEYSYTVAAKDAAGNTSAQSAALTAKTLPGQPADGKKMYITPPSGTAAPGTDLTVEVRVDAKDDQINAAQADIAYSSNLQFKAIDDATSDFGVNAQKDGGSGVVTIARGNTAALTGDKLLAKITFTVLAEGTGTVDVKDTSVALSAATNENILTAREDGNYTLGTASNPPPSNPPPSNPPPSNPPPSNPPPSNPPPSNPPPSNPPPSNPPPSNPPPSRPPTSSTTKPSTTTTTVTPQGNTTPVTLPNNSEVELSDPVTVQTVPNGSESVEKVEYYLNGKLIATIKEPPFSYSVDTKNLKNGTYQLTTKTYYEDGTVDTKNANLVVKNPMSFQQLMLQLGGLVWVIVLVLIIAGVAVWYVFFRNGGGGDGYDDTDGYMFGPTGMSGPTDPNTPAGPTYGPPAQGTGPYGMMLAPQEAVAADAIPFGRY
jgi:chitodextrinase